MRIFIHRYCEIHTEKLDFIEVPLERIANSRSRQACRRGDIQQEIKDLAFPSSAIGYPKPCLINISVGVLVTESVDDTILETSI